MLDDTGAKLILADEAGLPTARALARGERSLLQVDEAPDRGAGDPSVDVPPDAVAYVFHTSGSTGRPKGVYDTHRNVLHNILRYTNALRIGHDDRLTLLQSCSFSGSVSSLLCALLNGAATFPFNVRREGSQRLAEWLREEQITIYHSVPTIFRSFLSGDARFPDVRCIRLEGDRSSRVDVDLFRRHFEPGCLLVNGLGTTETGIARQFFVDHETEVDDGVLPVGYPVRDVDVCLLDQEGDQVEIGQVGEIAVRSAYLASGYWGRPDLTEAAFRPDPAGGRGRVYRTGDMGRMRRRRMSRVSGAHGLRPEGAGKQHRARRDRDGPPAPAGAGRGGRDDVRGRAAMRSQLVAYLVPSSGARISPTVLHRRLAETLPEFMIPSLFVPLDALPLDANGKLDRRVLPPPVLPERPSSVEKQPAWPARGAHRAPVRGACSGLERRPASTRASSTWAGTRSPLPRSVLSSAPRPAWSSSLSTLLHAPTVEALARLLGSSDTAAAHLAARPDPGEGLAARLSSS